MGLARRRIADRDRRYDRKIFGPGPRFDPVLRGDACRSQFPSGRAFRQRRSRMSAFPKSESNWPFELLIPAVGFALPWVLPDQPGFLTRMATTAILFLPLAPVRDYPGTV